MELDVGRVLHASHLLQQLYYPKGLGSQAKHDLGTLLLKFLKILVVIRDLSKLDKGTLTLCYLIFEVVLYLSEVSNELEVILELINYSFRGLLESSYFNQLLDD